MTETTVKTLETKVNPETGESVTVETIQSHDTVEEQISSEVENVAATVEQVADTTVDLSKMIGELNTWKTQQDSKTTELFESQKTIMQVMGEIASSLNGLSEKVAGLSPATKPETSSETETPTTEKPPVDQTKPAKPMKAKQVPLLDGDKAASRNRKKWISARSR